MIESSESSDPSSIAYLGGCWRLARINLSEGMSETGSNMQKNIFMEKPYHGIL